MTSISTTTATLLLLTVGATLSQGFTTPPTASTPTSSPSTTTTTPLFGPSTVCPMSPTSLAAGSVAAQAGDGAKPSIFGRVLEKLNPLRLRDYNRNELKDGIAAFYDESTAIWEEVWGEHLHHGYYYTGKETDHQQAQVDMIEESLKFAGVSDAASVKTAVDVGCGIGGSSRHLAKKYGAQVRGITLSPFQCRRAQHLSRIAGLEDKAKFQVADALAMPFQDRSFDLVWSMESGEHMPDKRQFMQELTRVAAPGGKIIIVTWCHRNLKPGETLTRFERGLLKLINSIYFLPPWVSMDTYVGLAQEAGLQQIKTADWTQTVKPFWPAVLRSCLSLKSMKVLFTSSTVRKGALAILYMMLGYSTGLIRFGVITGEKPRK